MGEEDTILISQQQNGKEEKRKEPWDRFENPPREKLPSSMVESKTYNFSIKAIRLAALLGAFALVLCGAVLSKTTLLFMTSQISQRDPKPLCNKLADRNRNYQVVPSSTERVLWIWMLFFAYCIPQCAIFMRSFRICFFRKCHIPRIRNLLIVCLVEGITAFGSAIFVYCVLPELDVVKGAMLTNAFCFIPAIQDIFDRYGQKDWGQLNMTFILKLIAAIFQLTAFFTWAIVEDNLKLWTIPLTILLISAGWWKNYKNWQIQGSSGDVTRDKERWRDDLAKCTSAEFNTRLYFIYMFASIWKCLVFLVAMIIIFFVSDEKVQTVFTDYKWALREHPITIKELMPIINADLPDLHEALEQGKTFTIQSDKAFPIWILLINVISSYVCYTCSKFASKIMIQKFSYALPANLAVPVTLSVLIGMSGNYIQDDCAYFGLIPSYLFFDVPSSQTFIDLLRDDFIWIWLLWLVSQTWITRHLWLPQNKKGASTEQLFIRPMYDPFLIDQDIGLNRRKFEENVRVKSTSRRVAVKSNTFARSRFEKGPDDKTRIYACGTMWHEEQQEMMAFMKSILRLDADQCARNIVKENLDQELKNDYNLETHVFFDDAFVRFDNNPKPYLNTYVQKFISALGEACSKVHGVDREWPAPKKYVTPYGGRLVWELPGGSSLVTHLKDKKKVMAKKRWSQVMYMYYLLGFRMEENEIREENTYILALDGDIDFQPAAVLHLVNKMQKDPSVGAACGRIHPVGSGPMVWFQNFEYAIGHWLQKATEHVIGCVLCSPGCFSLFRAKALMHPNVMKAYTTRSSKARHFVQYDQGEDRWLCTLLLKSGSRVEYSAASDAYTHAPEGFNEFYNQRRRWMPSTAANIMDILLDYKHVCEMNDNISSLYIIYQGLLMVLTVLGPGSIFLILVGAFVAAFQLDQWTSFLWNFIPVVLFLIICKWFKSDVQLFFAGLLSAFYGLVMMAVLVGILLQIRNDGPFAPSSLFFFCIASEMIIAAILHPKEIRSLIYGIIYYITIPSMYLLLVIYSIFNMNNVSWGTRETVIITKKPEDESKETDSSKTKNRIWNIFGESDSNSGAIEFSLAGLFKCFLCTDRTPSREEKQLADIKKSIDDIQAKLGILQRPETEAAIQDKQPEVGEKKKEIKETSDEVFVDKQEKSDEWIDDDNLKNCECDQIDAKERAFWNGFIKEYMKPDNDPEDIELQKQKKRNKDLLDLRDQCVNAFFMLNALYVLVVFLLTLKKDELHIKWPLSPKTNFTYFAAKEEIQINFEYLQLEPIGMVFVVFFGVVLVIQFVAMIKHRFSTLCEILANTELIFPSIRFKKELNLVQKGRPRGEVAVDLVKRIQKLKVGDDEVKDEWKDITNLREAYKIRQLEVAANKRKVIKGIPRKTIWYLHEAGGQQVSKLDDDNMLITTPKNSIGGKESKNVEFVDFAKNR